MSGPKERALELWTALDRAAGDARERAEQHRLAELAAFHDGDADDARREMEMALEYVARGEALAYEDASLRVKLFAAGIPEDA